MPHQQTPSKQPEQAFIMNNAQDKPAAKKPSLFARVMTEKNRLVQQMMVTFRFAKPTTNGFLKQKRQEYVIALEQLQLTKERIEAYSNNLLTFTESVTDFAGNASDVGSTDASSQQANANAKGTQYTTVSFRQSAKMLEEKAHEFLERVDNQILPRLDQRVEELNKIHGLLEERLKLQLDLDYATRKLALAQQRGDVNEIATRKEAVEKAQAACDRVTASISSASAQAGGNQSAYVDEILQQFCSMIEEFFATSISRL